MKRLLSACISLSLLLCLAACGNSSQTEANLSASAYINQLWEGLENAELPVEELKDGSTSEGSDSDIGEYLYTGYIVTDGVYVSIYESKDQSDLLRVQVMMDMSLAQRDQISTGAFAITNMVYFFDEDDAEDILSDLNVEDFTSPGISEANGQHGEYEYMVDPMNQKIFLVYTLEE